MGFFPLVRNTLTPGEVQLRAELMRVRDGAGPNLLQGTVQETFHQRVR